MLTLFCFFVALNKIVEVLAGFAEGEHHRTPVKAFCCFWDEDPEDLDYFLWAWNQILSLRSNDWDCSGCILQPQSLLDYHFAKASTHSPDLKEVKLGDPDRNQRENGVLFRVFEKSDSEKECQGADRLVAECYIKDSMHHFAPSLSLLVEKLLSLPLKFNAQFVMIECVMGEMFKLPATEQKQLFYQSLLTTIMRQNPRLGGVYFKAVNSLYQRISVFDPECRERLLDALSYHLSNFSFKWEWSFWEDSLTLPEDDQKVIFVRGLLGRCVRLSYWKNIEDSISKKFVDLMPPFPKPNTEEVAVDEELAKRIKAGETIDADGVTVDTLLPCLLKVGETFSLFKGLLRKYGPLLRKLASEDEEKLNVLKIVGKYWANSEGHRLMIADILMGTLIVDHLAIVSWVFSEHSASLLSFSPWEVLHMAVGKTLTRTEILKSRGDEHLDKLEQHLREEKDLFLTIFQRFAILAESYLENVNEGEENEWFKGLMANMIAFGRRYHSTIKSFMSTLETFVFSDDCDKRIIEAFENVKKMR